MISPELQAQILRLHHSEGWPVGTIARQLRVHHETVERVLAQEGVPVAKPVRASMIEPYRAFIVETLTRYPTLRASRLYEMVRSRGYPGGPDHFRALVASLRPRPPAEAYLRLRALPGEQAQADWALCRSRHRAHYAEPRIMPSHCLANGSTPEHQAVTGRVDGGDPA
jgi:transposase